MSLALFRGGVVCLWHQRVVLSFHEAGIFCCGNEHNLLHHEMQELNATDESIFHRCLWTLQCRANVSWWLLVQPTCMK